MGKPWDKLLKRMSDGFAVDILRHLAGIEGVLGLEALPDEVPGRRAAEASSVVPDRLYRMETEHGPRVLVYELLARGLRRILKEAKNPDRIRELVGDLILLAKRRLPTEEIQRTTRKETGMSELPMVDELLEEGRLAEARQSVLDILETRFEEVPADLAERLEAIDDLERLGELRREAIRCPDPASFLDRLED